MNDKIQKPGGVLVRKGTGLAALQNQIKGAAQAMIPPDESLVLVLDVSPSMGEGLMAPNNPHGYPTAPDKNQPTKIQVCREAAMALITKCSVGRTQVGVVEFGGHARVHEAMSADLQRVGQAINRIAGGNNSAGISWEGFIGGTNLVGGLAMAWNAMLRDLTTKIKRIVIMTDGGDNSLYGGGEPNLNQLQQYKDIFKTHNVIVDCVAFGADADRALLAQIAGATGVVKDAKNADELVKAFAQLEAGARGLLPKGT